MAPQVQSYYTPEGYALADIIKQWRFSSDGGRQSGVLKKDEVLECRIVSILDLSNRSSEMGVQDICCRVDRLANGEIKSFSERALCSFEKGINSNGHWMDFFPRVFDTKDKSVCIFLRSGGSYEERFVLSAKIRLYANDYFIRIAEVQDSDFREQDLRFDKIKYRVVVLNQTENRVYNIAKKGINSLVNGLYLAHPFSVTVSRFDSFVTKVWLGSIPVAFAFSRFMPGFSLISGVFPFVRGSRVLMDNYELWRTRLPIYQRIIAPNIPRCSSLSLLPVVAESSFEIGARIPEEWDFSAKKWIFPNHIIVLRVRGNDICPIAINLSTRTSNVFYEAKNLPKDQIQNELNRLSKCVLDFTNPKDPLFWEIESRWKIDDNKELVLVFGKDRKYQFFIVEADSEQESLKCTTSSLKAEYSYYDSTFPIMEEYTPRMQLKGTDKCGKSFHKFVQGIHSKDPKDQLFDIDHLCMRRVEVLSCGVDKFLKVSCEPTVFAVDPQNPLNKILVKAEAHNLVRSQLDPRIFLTPQSWAVTLVRSHSKSFSLHPYRSRHYYTDNQHAQIIVEGVNRDRDLFFDSDLEKIKIKDEEITGAFPTTIDHSECGYTAVQMNEMMLVRRRVSKIAKQGFSRAYNNYIQVKANSYFMLMCEFGAKYKCKEGAVLISHFISESDFLTKEELETLTKKEEETERKDGDESSSAGTEKKEDKLTFNQRSLSYKERSQVWRRSSNKVWDMVLSIIHQKNDSSSLPRLDQAGRYSIKNKVFKVDSCITWALDVLQKADIKLDPTYSGKLIGRERGITLYTPSSAFTHSEEYHQNNPPQEAELL